MELTAYQQRRYDTVVETTKSKEQYNVYYDEQGLVVSVNTRIDENSQYSYITVPSSHVSAILNGEKSALEYRVKFDDNLKQYKLAEYVEEKPSVGFKATIIQMPIYESVPSDKAVDILVTYNGQDKTLSIKFSQETLSTVKGWQPFEDKYMEFFVTKKDTPHKLIKPIKFFLSDLNENGELVVNNVDIGTKASIYCKQIFTDYAFVQL